MKTVKMVDRDLNEAEVSTIERAMRLFLGENQFALIGENVIVPFENDDCSDPEMLEKCVEETTEEILSSHPDFETFFMKEKYGIVAMQDYKVLGFTAGSLSEDEEKKVLYKCLKQLNDFFSPEVSGNTENGREKTIESIYKCE